MKENIGYLFVDDGYPEAEEYETNYISYNMADPGSYKRAVENARFPRAGSSLSDTLVFRTVPLDACTNHRLPRSYRRRRLPTRIRHIRNTLIRLVKN